MVTAKVVIPTIELDGNWNEKPSAIDIAEMLKMAVRMTQYDIEPGTVRVFGLALGWHFDVDTVDMVNGLLQLKLPPLKANLESFDYIQDDVSGGSRIEATVAI